MSVAFGELAADADVAEVARAAGLHHVHDSEPGITRRVQGRGFSYVHADGEVVSDRTRDRIEALAIPPAWTDVWISADPRGHLLATGRDDAGRKQYLYHERWREARDEQKFHRLVAFGEHLSEIRQAVTADLRGRRLTLPRATAAVVRLMDRTLIRVGNEVYAADNETFGATTLEPRHVHAVDEGFELRFDGKGGVEQRLFVTDPRTVRVVRACLEVDSPQLFCALKNGQAVDVTSEHVNDYLRRVAGDGTSAKALRTWGATVIAAGELAPLDNSDSVDAQVLDAIDAAAEALGNTRAVCRSCYVAPAIPAAHRSGELAEAWRSSRTGRWRSRAESAALKVLEASAADAHAR